MRQITLTVQGMKCEGCASAVREALAEVAGVDEVEVRLEDARAVVTVQEDADVATLIGAVGAAGYAAAEA